MRQFISCLFPAAGEKWKSGNAAKKKNPITFLVLSLCRRRNALLNLSREDGDTIRYVNLLSISFPRG